MSITYQVLKMNGVYVVFQICLILRITAGQDCDQGWILEYDKCYYFSTYSDTWVESMRECYQHNSDLASIETREENMFLESYVKNHSAVYWIGGTSETKNNTWLWIQTNRPLTFTDWFPGEPNNHNGNEHCMEINPTRKWNDENCEHSKYFICEKNKYVWTTVSRE